MILSDSVVQSTGLDSDRLRPQEALFDRKKPVAPEIDILCDTDKSVPDTVEQGHMTTAPTVFDNHRPDSDNIRE